MCGEGLVEDQFWVYRLERLELLGTFVVVARHGSDESMEVSNCELFCSVLVHYHEKLWMRGLAGCRDAKGAGEEKEEKEKEEEQSWFVSSPTAQQQGD